MEPEKPGFASVRIEPHPGNLTEVSGTIPHPKGNIKVHYKKRTDGSYTAEINLPAGLPGDFVSNNKKIRLRAGYQVIRFHL